MASGEIVRYEGSYGKRGPYRFDEQTQFAFLARVAIGTPIVTAAAMVGVSPRIIYWHRKHNADFADKLTIAIAQADDMVEASLFRQATTGNNVIASLSWLYNRRPGRWQDRRKVTVVTAEAVDSQISALRARLAELEGSSGNTDDSNGDDLN